MSIGILGFIVWSQIIINLLFSFIYKDESLDRYKYIKNIFNLSTRYFTINLNQNLNPYFVTGFCDGEAYFNVSISKNSKLKTGWAIKLSFGINLHKKDLDLLENIKVYFKDVGVVSVRDDSAVKFTVTSLADLEIIMNHFDKYPLITQKWADYILFKQIFDLVKHKEHLTEQGLNKIISFKANLNKGLNDELKEAFEDIDPALRPVVLNQEIQDPNWMAGFISAEGCFRIKISKSNTHKTGYSVGLRFFITQHIRDEQLLMNFKEYFGCGEYKQRKGFLAGDFNVNKISDISDIIIPFLSKYPIYGIKANDFKDFCKALELIKNENHLTKEGLELLIKLKNEMNSTRKNV